MTKESAKKLKPDELLAFPIFYNPPFRIRKHLQPEWHLHPQLARIDTLLTDKGENRPAMNIKQIIKELVPSIQTVTLKKLVAPHAQSIQKRIPAWFKRRLNKKREWEQQEQ
eukprot:6212074-Pleurochrysis_carterae.AAC.1